MNNQKGQLILTLILVMTVALAIGLSVVQKSLVDVSTSTKVEQSSRAFSAAEAGIEKALRGDTSGVNFPESNAYSLPVGDISLIPCTPGVGTCPAGQQDPLEYPPVAKEDVIQFWLADPNPAVTLPGCTATDYTPVCYQKNSLEVYWGNSESEEPPPAISLTFVYYASGQYQSQKVYLDPNTQRAEDTNFTPVTCTGNNPLGENNYQCHRTISGLPSNPMLLRARLLYNDISQPVAIRSSCSDGSVGCYLPPQAREIISTGISGETQRRVQLFQLNNVVPPYFDYAIFSAGDIEK